MTSQEENTTEIPATQESEPVTTGRKRKASQRSGTTNLPPKPKKIYPKRAPVWQHFIVQENDRSKTNCRYCGLELGCDSKMSGTSPMISHNERCKKFKDFNEREKQEALGSDSSGNMKVIKYDPLQFRRSVNEMVLVNELPFSFVESEGWKRFCFNVLPLYQTFSRRTCGRDVVAMYLEEKAKLKELFKVEKQRVSLTTDIWVSPTTSYNYMVVTAHWIDSNWQFQKRILSFKVITDHKGETIAGQLIDCIEDWGLDRIFTVTVDNAKANDRGLLLFRGYLRQFKGVNLLLDGELMHMRCCAHILNLVVGDGLKQARSSIVGIRNAIKYVRSSFTRLRSFVMRCETGKIQRGSLPLDCITRWNSTFLMLNAALKYRVAFEKMLYEDKLYCDYFLEEDEKTKTKRLGPPTFSDWDDVQRLVKFLKIFYKCTLAFSASKSVTSSSCYSEIVNIERNLITKCGNRDEEIRKQARVIRDKFDKYWDGLLNMNPLVIIGSVFDPRNKMQFASLCFEQLYGKDTVESTKIHNSVTKVIKELYKEYSAKLGKPLESQDSCGTSYSEQQVPMCEFSDDEDDCEGIQTMYDKMVGSSTTAGGCSELDVYLTEKTEMRMENSLGMTFDVLSWWKHNSSKFPILSELTRDVLAIQVSSLASESVFSTSGRVLDPYRSSLTPYLEEVLLCTQQWLRCSFKSEAQVVNIVQMLEEVEFFDSLDSMQSASSGNL